MFHKIRFTASIPDMSRKLQKFFEKKRAVLWSVKNESGPRRESGITRSLNLPTTPEL
jgi:hypothetical protein